jgi:hypothetical protein
MKVILFIIILFFLAGCGTKVEVVPPSYPLPPITLFQEVPDPSISGKYNRDLSNLLYKFREALAISNDNKKKLLLWFEENLNYNKEK